MLIELALLVAHLGAGAPPATRVAVLLDDPAQGTPAAAALEATLQRLGYEVVAAEASERMRKVVAPSELLGTRLPEGLSVFEADAVLAGAVSYGEPAEVEGVQSVPVSMTVRLVDLGTGQATATFQADGVGVGVLSPALRSKAASQATQLLFKDKGLEKALGQVGQQAGSVVLVVQGLPNRESLVGLRTGLEKALAGAPVRELYFAKGLGKLILGGSKSPKAMVGPDIADIISQDRTLALVVDEVANTRIVARYDRARTVHVHALVLEPKLPKGSRLKADELGKYVATQLATFEFARASYQRGKLSRDAAAKRARSIQADVLVESEVLGSGDTAALAIRVVDVATGRPILRQQQLIGRPEAGLDTAQTLLASLATALPEKISELRAEGQAGPRESTTTAKKED